MKNAAVYAKAALTVYTQPSNKKEYEYDTVLKGEEVGLATGEMITNTTGKYWQLARIGVANYFYAKADNLTYNQLDAQSNILEEVVVTAKKKTVLPYIIAGVALLSIVLIIVLSKD